MSQGDDRIPVATNGHRRPLRDAGEIEGEHAPGGGPATATPASEAPRPGRTPHVNPVMGPPAFTPTQVAVGFGLVASLILLLLGRRRRRR